jgi:lincosamide nucleotidyltransferase
VLHVNVDAYNRVLGRLTDWAAGQPAVLGFVAVGSTAGTSRTPDQWSDHDLILVTREGAAQAYRDDLSWLPDAQRIVVSRRETEHAYCVILDDGHLMEIAVFNDSELDTLDVNSYRVLLDHAGLAHRLARMMEQTTVRLANTDIEGNARLQHLLTELVVGLSRYGRGEHLSAHHRVRAQALPILLALIADFTPAEASSDLDGLDPHRRFELAYPRRGAHLLAALERPIPETVGVMLRLIEDLVGVIPAATPQAVDAVRAVADRIGNREA